MLYKAVLVNDTSKELHHGCTIVIQNIIKLLKLNNIIIYKTISVEDNWKAIKNIDEIIKNSDLVIVNGEGTIHHNQVRGKNLIQIGEFCKKLKIPTYLINCTYQDNDKDFFAKYLKYFNLISVRESLSKNQLDSINIKSHIVPDLSFYSNYNELNINHKKNQTYLISDSVYFEISKYLLNFSYINKNFVFIPILSPVTLKQISPIKILSYIKYHLKKIVFILLKLNPQNHYEIRYFGLNDYKKYILKLKNSKMIISGRYHCMCLAINLLKPFLIIKSNSHKIEGLLNDIGISENRIINKNDLKNSNLINFKFTEDEIKKIEEFKLKAKIKIEKFFTLIKNDLINER